MDELLLKYQKMSNKTALYAKFCNTHNERITYCMFGLAGETGEISEKLKKHLRAGGALSELVGDVSIAKELGDVLWYVTRLADELGFSLGEVMQMNHTKLTNRFNRGTLHGSGDER